MMLEAKAFETQLEEWLFKATSNVFVMFVWCLKKMKRVNLRKSKIARAQRIRECAHT